MTLIALMSALLSPRCAASAASGNLTLHRSGYHPGASHRPVAAMIAIGLPAALVVAVALSPMIIDPAPRSDPFEGTLIKLPPPPPPPDPDSKPQQEPQSTKQEVTTTPSPLPPVAQDPPVFQEVEPYVPLTGTGAGPSVAAAPPAPPPKLVLADLDKRFLGDFQPSYPAREQREGAEGVATVRVLIGTDGRVKAVELVRTDSNGFFEETKRRALAKWRFKPATRGGVAEESWKVMTVRFEIRNG